VSSDKIEKNNKKKIHTESSYAYFPILFHIRIFAVCCVSAAKEKKGVGERDPRTHDSRPATHVYFIYVLCFVLLSFFKTAGEGKKKYHKNINRSKEYHEATQTTDSNGIEETDCVLCIKICWSA
jgi:hypothetical protein